MVIRPPRAAELSELSLIECEADRRYIDSPFPELAGTEGLPLDVAARLHAEGRLLVAAAKDHVVGFLGWCVEQDPAYFGISQVSVRPEHGRRGIGTRLMKVAIDLARAGDHHWVVLNTQLDVPWNEPWYRRLGFEVVPSTEWPAWMRQCVDDQKADGISWDRRVWMRLAVG